MSFPRRRESIFLVTFLYFFLHPSVIASTALGAWQSCIMSLRAQIYQGAAISLFFTRILQLVFCISFYFFITSSLTYTSNPLFLYKLNTKYQQLTTDFNNYPLFLYANLHFSLNKNYKKTIFFINITIFTL